MNLEELREKLLAAARSHPPADHVPYAFEKRVIHLLSARPLQDIGAFWATALWRATAPCAAIMLALAAWAFFTPSTPSRQTSVDLTQEFENTLLAGAYQEALPTAD